MIYRFLMTLCILTVFAISGAIVGVSLAYINQEINKPASQVPEPVAPVQKQAPSTVNLPYYSNCKVAWAVGAAPLNEGEPGYRPGLDKDHDGTACE